MNNYIRPNEIQEKALNAVKFSRNPDGGVTVMPPGSGKTHHACDVATFRESDSILFIAPKIEIVEQAARTFASRLSLSDDKIGIVQGPTKELERPFLFCTVQTLAKDYVLEKLAHRKFDLFVIDEYHHANAPKTYDRIIQFFKPETGRTNYMLGLTATPFRLDGKDPLVAVGGNIVYQASLEETIRLGINVPFRYYAFWDDINYDNIRWNGTSYYKKDLNKALFIDARDAQIIREFKGMALQTKQTLGFCATIEHCVRMASKFNAAGIIARALTHKVGPKDRKQIVEDFRSGKIRAVFVRDIFNEGIDFPEVECLLMLRPTLSKGVFYQQLGRGLRKFPGKRFVTVLDFIGNYRKSWQMQKWLKEMGTIEEDDFQTKDREDREKKEDYFHNVSTVHFDHQIIDFWENERKKNQTIKKRLVEGYTTLKRRNYGQPPTRQQLTDYVKINVNFYYNSYEELLKAAGEPEHMLEFIATPVPLEQDLIDRWFSLWDRLGRMPSEQDLKATGQWDDFVKMFGSVDKFKDHILFSPEDRERTALGR